MRWALDWADGTDQIHVAGEDSEQDIEKHDKVQSFEKSAAGWNIDQENDIHCTISR